MFEAEACRRIAVGDTVRLNITGINNLGCGVGKIEGGVCDGTVVFVNGAVTGDVDEVKIIKVNRTYLVARLEKVIKPSAYRAEGICDAPLACGGCTYRNISYEHELEIKREYVSAAFRKVGLPDASVLTVLSVGERKNYRNKAMYPVGRLKNGITAGFYASKSHNIIPVGKCAIQNAEFAPIVRFVCDFAALHGISVYDENNGKGLIRHIYLRAATGTGEIMVCLVINGEKFPYADIFTRELAEKFPSVTGILLNINKNKTNVVIGERFMTLYGRDYIEDILCGLRFRITPQSFYQVNRKGAELLYSTAKKLAAPDRTTYIIDLYCGTGTIGLTMADAAREIIGVEIVESAVECARENARLNAIENASFYCGDASSPEKLLEKALAGREDILKSSIVILDPPRKGSTFELIEFLCRNNVAKIVYVSCAPDTLARDIVDFRKCGYEMGDIQPVDMFPGTGHIETVCLLSKLNAKQHIEVDLHMDELDLTDAEKKATYSEIKAYVLEHTGLKVSSLYIAQVKQKCGIIERENYNKPKSEDAKQPLCPPDKEKAIKEALLHFGMI